MPGGKDSSFCSKLLKGNAGNPVLSPIKKRQDGFTVSHFAGIVPYSSERFLTKNRDLLSEDCVRCLSLSENDLVVKLIDQRPVAPPDGQRRRSVLRGSRERQAQTGTGQGRGGEFCRAGRLGETVGFAAPEDMMAGKGDTLGQPEGHWTVAREEIGQGGRWVPRSGQQMWGIVHQCGREGVLHHDR